VALIISLHAYGGSGAGHEDYFRLNSHAEARGFLYCYPDGTIDDTGTSFWNGGNFAGSAPIDVDDAGYLRGLIEDIQSKFSVDPKRIYVIGHSNGGIMAYRMASQYAGIIAGIAALAGATLPPLNNYKPTQPVHILHIHGTADNTLPYSGVNDVPGAVKSIQLWAGYNGATAPVTDAAPSMNLDLAVAGLDTVVTRYTKAPADGAVELWTINGGGHGPMFYNGVSSSEFATGVIDWLLAHPKP
jgi:polyhydroxybutyrate depolymerase